jgi:hypothetical protein
MLFSPAISAANARYKERLETDGLAQLGQVGEKKGTVLIIGEKQLNP